ncbi:MAG: hypothetical protein ABWY00_08835 [Dongiaceae bacterium]
MLISAAGWPVVIGVVAIAFAAIAAAIAYASARNMAIDRSPAAPLSRFDAAFIAAASLFILIARLPLLQLSRELQPDEAQHGANALTMASRWLNWDTVDSGSSGPLNSMIHAWPLLFGLDITYTTIHLTGIVLASAMSGFVYLGLRKLVGLPQALVFALPATLFLGAGTYWDLVHTSSLYLPLTLMTFGLFAAISVWRRPSLPLAIVAGFVLGLIPLAKPQVVLLGAYAGLALLVAQTRSAATFRDGVLKALAIALAAVAPLAVSLGCLAAAGHFNDFVTEVFIYSRNYYGHLWGPRYWIRMAWGIPLLASMVILYAAAIIGFGLWWCKNGRRSWGGSQATTWFALGLVLIGCLTILAPGQRYPLYLLVLVPILPVAAAALAQEVLAHRTAWRLPHAWQAGLATVAVMLVMLPCALWDAATSPAFRAQGALLANGPRLHGPHLLGWLLPEKSDHLIVYGYMPYLYVDAGMPSGTREAWSENVVANWRRNPEIAQYRDRFIAEMDDRRPSVVIDAVASGSFLYHDPALMGPSTFPALAERLARDYEPVPSSPTKPACPQIYLRRDRVDRVHAALVEAASVTASSQLETAAGAYAPANVIDRQVFETCLDRWLAREAAPAWLQVTLAKPERIALVELLNTRGEWLSPDADRIDPGTFGAYPYVHGNVASYHAALSAVVELMRGDTVVATKRIQVDGYPYWTKIGFDTAQEATAIRIEFPDWRGAGPGLNEVMAIRAGEAQAFLDTAR